MSAVSYTDWTVFCNGPDPLMMPSTCGASLGTHELEGRDLKAADVRKILRRRGWTVSAPVRNEDGRLVYRGDFCPDHKPANSA